MCWCHGGRRSWTKWWDVAGVLAGEGWMELLSKLECTLYCISDQGRALLQWWYVDPSPRANTSRISIMAQCCFGVSFLITFISLVYLVRVLLFSLDESFAAVLELPPVVVEIRSLGLLVDTLLLLWLQLYAGTDPLSVFRPWRSCLGCASLWWSRGLLWCTPSCHPQSEK